MKKLKLSLIFLWTFIMGCLLFDVSPVFSQSTAGKELIRSYSELVEETRDIYKDCSDAAWKKEIENFEQLNMKFETHKDALSDADKDRINKLRGEFAGYRTMRESIKITQELSEGLEDAWSKTEGFLAAVKYQHTECALFFEVSDVSQLLLHYKNLVKNVEKSYEGYTKETWRSRDSVFNCINYQLYQRKDDLSDYQKEKSHKLKTDYLKCKYDWKSKHMFEKMNEGLNDFTEKSKGFIDAIKNDLKD